MGRFLAPLRDGPTAWVRPLGKALATGGEVGVYQASAAAAQGAPPEEALREGLSGVEAGTAVGLGAEALAPAAGAAGMRLGPRRPAAEELLLVFFVGSPCLGEEGAGFLDVFGAVQLMILSGGEGEVKGVSARPGSPSS